MNRSHGSKEVAWNVAGRWAREVQDAFVSILQRRSVR
jgi:hypothetical protein